MERHALSGVAEYDRYGPRVHKQAYFYGGLDVRPSELDRSYGMSWGVGGWLIFDELRRMAPGRVGALRARIAAGMRTTFASSFTAELSMTELMEPDNLRTIAARSTGRRF